MKRRVSNDIFDVEEMYNAARLGFEVDRAMERDKAVF
jgi:hypothetical protein